MKRIFLFLLLIPRLSSAQKIATFLFDNNLTEVTERYPALKPIGKLGKFQLENIPQFGSGKQYVYVFEQNAGLQFVNEATKNFVRDSYTVEMFFRYDNGELSLYNFILGTDASLRGHYHHLIFTRDAPTKQVKMYLNGELKHEYIDSNDDAAVTPDAEMSFFQNDIEAKTPRSSGAVALIKIYNFRLDAPAVKQAFVDLKQDFKTATYLPDLLDAAVIGKKIPIKDIQFYQSKAEPLRDAYDSMDKLSEYLIKNSQTEIELQGHTDNIGDFDLNLQLSKQRVEFVKNYIVSRGIDNKRITTRGFGSTRPTASNSFEEGKRLNRRVEVIITKK